MAEKETEASGFCHAFMIMIRPDLELFIFATGPERIGESRELSGLDFSLSALRQETENGKKVPNKLKKQQILIL